MQIKFFVPKSLKKSSDFISHNDVMEIICLVWPMVLSEKSYFKIPRKTSATESKFLKKCLWFRKETDIFNFHKDTFK